MEQEIWKDIPWYEGLYRVSNSWKVLSINSKKILETSDVTWYKRVSLKWKKYLVHRLVYCTFKNISIIFKWQQSRTLILHKNDNRNDNRLTNLFIWTQKDNMTDMINKWRWKTWRTKKIKIWFDDIDNIKILYTKLHNIYKVAEIYNVSWATISRVLNWKIWVK